MDQMTDIFAADGFSVATLTDSINAVPFVPGRAGALIDWDERGVPTTTIQIEEREGALQLLNPTPRGGAGSTSTEAAARIRSLVIPHYEHNDFLLADSVQNVRAFGTTSALEMITDRVNRRLQEAVQWKLDPTLELQRVGAIKGVITNADGSVLYNLFNEFGISQVPEIDFDLDNAAPASGALRKACAQAVRKVTDQLGGVVVGGVHALCGDAFFDDLLAHPEVVESYRGSSMASVLREGYVTPAGTVYGVFEFGGIVWENYRGRNGTTPFIAADKCHIFPIGVPGLWRTVYAPADWEETVNTEGLPRYARQYAMANGKGRHLDVQMNALSYCTRPGALLQGKRT